MKAVLFGAFISMILHTKTDAPVTNETIFYALFGAIAGSLLSDIIQDMSRIIRNIRRMRAARKSQTQG